MFYLDTYQADLLRGLAFVTLCLLFSFLNRNVIKSSPKTYGSFVMSFSAFTPRLAHNWNFAVNAAKILNEAYGQFKNETFKLVRSDGDVYILPPSLLDEVSALPPAIASPHGALEHDLLGPYTGLNLILESRLHHSIVQRKLTPRLGLLTPGLQKELIDSFEQYFPRSGHPNGAWTSFQPYQVFAKISARLSGRALVGNTLCKDPSWVNLSIEYTESLFRTVVILRMFPTWLHPLVSKALPSYWRGRSYVGEAKRLLAPIFRDLIARNDDSTWSPRETEEDYNVLCWLADTAKGRDRDAEKLAHVQVLLALAAVHTTLLRMVNVLYDVTADPELLEELREEIHNAQSTGWGPEAYSNLPKLDSVLRESQRMSPPTILGLKRLFRQSYTFSNGLHVKQGTYVCLPTYAIENDPANTTSPETFDGLRHYRVRESLHPSTKALKGPNSDQHLFSSPDRVALNFGYGKSACPGRFFASLVIKMALVKALTQFDFAFMPGSQRPKNLMAHEFLFCWPWQRMLIKPRETGQQHLGQCRVHSSA